MTSIDFASLMTTVFILVDDWYQQQQATLPAKRRGARVQFSDSEVLTLALLMDYVPFPGKPQFLGFIRASYHSWVSQLLDQSQFNRRSPQLDGVLESLRRSWVEALGGTQHMYLLVNTKPF
ncbi:hypothetical protein [Leptolyngbya sp. FACHB-36]|uniref:hypothetical protein n=1 Tax=Leptolyngbya sp. FACHB-36 TaxID=2692808 RepID=UPI0018F03B5A|nr:hypothetical protein [Leptolyngbya sp. FACHB-36]